MDIKENIASSFMNLAIKEHASKIPVKQICEAAHISRTTFYKYFKDVYDVIEYIIKQDAILNFHTYVESHKQCMNYPEYEAKGYFVGSGAIESCHRYTMQNRMKQPGQRWNVETGQGILSMKSRYESGNWDEVVELCKLDYLGLQNGRFD